MSCKGRFDPIFFFLRCLTFVSWSHTSCSAWRTTMFDLNQELKDVTIPGDAALTLYDVKQPVTCGLRCSEKFPCAFFFHNAAVGVCVLHPSFGMSTNLTHGPGYKLFTLAEFRDVTSDGDTGLCPDNAETPQGCWKRVSGSLTHVSVGPAGMWGIKGNSEVFYMLGTYGNLSTSGRGLSQISGVKMQVDVGSDFMCGVNVASRGNELYCRVGVSSSRPTGDPNGGDGAGWVKITSNRTWISISPAGSVWAVDTVGQVLHARNPAIQLTQITQWDVIGTGMQRVDAGRAGVWALGNSGRLYYRQGSYGDDGSPTGTGWQMLGGTFSSISSGTNFVVAVTSEGRVWIRIGLSSGTPTGLGWMLYPGVMKQVEVYEAGTVAGLWAIDFSSKIYFSVLKK